MLATLPESINRRGNPESLKLAGEGRTRWQDEKSERVCQ